MSEAIAIEHELPQNVVSCAITAGCSPRAVEVAMTERQAEVGKFPSYDPLLVLARQTQVSMTIIGALAERWGIA